MTKAENTNSLTKAAEKIFTDPFGAVINLRSEEGGEVWVDGRKTPPSVSAKSPSGVVAADCILSAAPDILMRVLSGERALESAYVAGRLGVSGDMSVMARLELAPAK